MYNVQTIVDTKKSVNNQSKSTYTNSTPFLFDYLPWKMVNANRVTLISLDLFVKEWQRMQITINMLSTDYPIPKDVSSPALIKTPGSNSNGFQSTNSLCTRLTTNKPSSIDLQQRIAPDFANSCQTNFHTLHLTKEPEPLSETIKLKRNESFLACPQKRNSNYWLYDTHHLKEH